MPNAQQAAADRVAEAIERELLRLVMVDQIQPDLVLSAALAKIAGTIAGAHGGADAATVLREIAARVEPLPAHAERPLAGMPAAGRA